MDKTQKLLIAGLIGAGLLLSQGQEEPEPPQMGPPPGAPDPAFVRYLIEQCRQGNPQACQLLQSMGIQPPPPLPPEPEKLPPGVEASVVNMPGIGSIVGPATPTSGGGGGNKSAVPFADVLRAVQGSMPPGSTPGMPTIPTSFFSPGPSASIVGAISGPRDDLKEQPMTSIVGSVPVSTIQEKLEWFEHAAKPVNIALARQRNTLNASEILHMLRTGNTEELRSMMYERNREILLDTWDAYAGLSDILAAVLLAWNYKNRPTPYPLLDFFTYNIFQYSPHVISLIRAGMSRYIDAPMYDVDWTFASLPLRDPKDEAWLSIESYVTAQSNYFHFKNSLNPCAMQFPHTVYGGRNKNTFNTRWFDPAVRIESPILQKMAGTRKDLLNRVLGSDGSINGSAFLLNHLPPPLAIDPRILSQAGQRPHGYKPWAELYTHEWVADVINRLRESFYDQMIRTSPMTFMWERALIRTLTLAYLSKIDSHVAEMGFAQQNVDVGAFFTGMGSALAIASSNPVGAIVGGLAAGGALIAQLVLSGAQAKRVRQLETHYTREVAERVTSMFSQCGIQPKDFFFARHFDCGNTGNPGIMVGAHAFGLYENSYLHSPYKNLFNLYLNPSPFYPNPAILYQRIDYDVPMGVAKPSDTWGTTFYAHRLSRDFFQSSEPQLHHFPAPMMPFTQVLRVDVANIRNVIYTKNIGKTPGA